MNPFDEILDNGRIALDEPMFDANGNLPFLWQDPSEIKSLMPPVLKMEKELFPQSYSDWLEDVADRMQSPADFTVISIIVITASIIGSGCSIKPKARDGWEVIPNLWGACIGRPSVVLKSPSMGEAMKLLDRLQAKYGLFYEQEKKDAEFDEMMQESAKKGIKSKMDKVAKGIGKDSVVNSHEVEKLKADFISLSENDDKLTRRLFKANETSVQSMTELQNENPRGLLVFRDELTGALVRWDREDCQDERAYFLEGWNGNGSYTDVKIGRGITDAKNICIGLLGGIQPDKLKRYLYQAMRGNNDGLMQRLQLSVWPDEPKIWKNVDRQPNRDAREYAYNILSFLADADFTQLGAIKEEYDDRPHFRFSESAQLIFNDWLAELQTVKIKYEENPLMVEHFGKYRSLMPSLSLIFHLIDIADGEESGPVTERSALLAVQWCTYLESHARRIYAMAEDPAHEAAVCLSKKIRDKSLSGSFTTRHILRKGWQGLKDNNEIKDACQILVDENWLCEAVKIKPTSGRPPATEYLINPELS